MNDETPHSPDAPRSRWRSCLALFQTFATVSAISLGGGLVMIPVIQKEFVEKRRWLSENDMLDTIALTQSLPGIIAVNISTLIGYRIAGIPGVAAAVTGVVFPPFTAIIVVAALFFNIMDTHAVQCIFKGIRSGVCAMMLGAAIKLGRKTLTGAFEITIAAAGLIAMLFLNVGILWLLFGAAVAGIIVSWGAWRRAKTAVEQGGPRP